MRRAALVLTLIALFVSLAELSFALRGHALLFGTPGFFAMHLVVMASIVAAAKFSPALSFQGGTLLLNRLKPQLPQRAYRFLMLCFSLTLISLLVASLSETSSVPPAVYFSAFWVLALASSATVLKYVQSPHVADA